MLEAITLHCGSAKTATTSLQDSLHAGAEMLAERGLLYPDLSSRTNHSDLFVADARDHEMPGTFGRTTPAGIEESRRKAEEFWSLLASRVEASSARHLILSSEYLFEFEDETLDAILVRLRGLCENVRGVLYLREPVGYYMSSAQQSIKFGAHLPDPGTCLEYRSRVERLSRVLGERLEVRKFAPGDLRDGDIVTDFLSCVTREPEELRARLPAVVANVSLSGEAMAVLEEFNRDVWGERRISGNPQDNTLIEHLTRAEEKGDYPRPRLRPWALAQVLAANAPDLDWLRTEHGIDLADAAARDGGEIAPGPTGDAARIDVETVFEIDGTLVERLRVATLLSLVNEEIGLRKSKEAMRIAAETVNATVKAATLKAQSLTRETDRLRQEVDRVGRKKRRATSLAWLLALPYVLLTFPVSVPALLYLNHRKKKKKATAKVARSFRQPALIQPAAEATSGGEIASAPVAPVLIWCPISVSGLTTQLCQMTAILRKAGVSYNISYHVNPTIEHAEVDNWIDRSKIDRPRVVFFMERYVPFERGFEEAFHVFYVNLDWLKPEAVSLARVYADVVLCPVPHRFEELKATFSNAKVLMFPWPPAIDIAAPRASGAAADRPIRVLYVGNDYDEKSRKSPFATVEAILACDRADLRFDLKFRSPLPQDVKAALLARPNVDEVIDRSTSPEEVEALYLRADVNLIPNESEGNGLSIIESFAKGVVPAVLDGHPMNDVVTDETGYLIPCTEVGMKEYASVYQTTARDISQFLESLDADGVERRRRAIVAAHDSLRQRQTDLEAVVRGALETAGLVTGKVPDGPLRIQGREVTTDGRGDAADLKAVFAVPAYNVYREPRLIDVHMTTSRRASVFRPTLQRLLETIDKSPFEHRLFLSADNPDALTRRVIGEFENRFDEVLATGTQMGLPYLWNSILDRSGATIARSEVRPDFVCYIQDDCLIQRPDTYFEEMVEAASLVTPGRLGYVSGYHTTVHSGFSEVTVDGQRYILSDSVDGKNFMARPKLLQSVGPLTWWFPDGMRRGNPGPIRGSHFDLWQWMESPNCLMRQGRINVIIPGLCEHTAQTRELSTWGNDTTEDAVADRVTTGKVYRTR